MQSHDDVRSHGAKAQAISPANAEASLGVGNPHTGKGQELQESHAWLSGIVDSAMDAIVTVDAEQRIVLFNSAAERMFGRLAADLLGKPLDRLIPARFREAHPLQMHTFGATGQTHRQVGALGTVTGLRANGEEFLIEGSISHALLDGNRYFTAILRDITERKRTEDALALFRGLVDRSHDSFEVIDPVSGRFVDVNEQACLELGYCREEHLSLRVSDIDPTVDELNWAAQAERIRSAGSMTYEGIHRRKDGTTFPVEVNIRWVELDRAYIVASARNITERNRAEQTLRESEERFRELAECIQDVFWVALPDVSRILYVSPAYEKVWGRSCASLYASPRSWTDAIHAEDRERVLQAAIAKLQRGTYDEEYRIVWPDGSIRWIRDRGFPVVDADGQVARIVGVARDVTIRRQLEMQLRQAQKMEAVGHLAGGVAHDFNNILSVITVHSDLLLMELPEPHSMRESLTEIHDAATRAAALTRQLLVFSRQEVVEPKVLDLNAVVTDAEKMLRRLIGEDVQLVTALSPGLDPVKIDPGHLGQIIMNLAVNARDAMPRGGRLTIETSMVERHALPANLQAEAEPGRRLLLAVKDTGSGMTPEVLTHIFEPFYTTKGLGRGTGLGLAVVHGIVKQAGGQIDVGSEVGVGAAFRIYLPAATEPLTKPVAFERPGNTRTGETILLVEDENGVRRITTLALQSLGYVVIAAANGADAIQAEEAHRGKIDLLVTDVVMPGMNGREVAEALRSRNPELKVLYQSGYTDDAIVRHGILQAEVAFLQKPFTLAALAAKLREVLGTAASA